LWNFDNRSLVLTQKYFDGVCPEAPDLTEDDKDILLQIEEIRQKVESSLEAFRIREALFEAMGLARLGNKYLAETEPWKVIKTDEERVKHILYVSLQITANLAFLLDPFIPFSMQNLRGFLNLEELPWETIGNISLIPSGHRINKPSLLFEKIDDKQVQHQVDKLLSTKKANEESNTVIAPAKALVSYDDFANMDIRIATILSAEKVAKTKKLIKLELDTGIDKRTVVSGIAEYFDPEKLIGKKVTLLANLAPRKIRGIESQGMILLAEHTNGELVFVVPDDDMIDGAEVK